MFVGRMRIFVWLCLWCVVGCADGRPELVEATGRVQQQGQAVTAGSIAFHPDTANAFRGDVPTSQLQLDGSFLMQTYPWGEGVSVGRYVVTLSSQLAGRLGLPEYANPEQSPLRVEVGAEGLRGHVIELPRSGSAGQSGGRVR